MKKSNVLLRCLVKIIGVLIVVILIINGANWLRDKYVDSKTNEMFQSGRFLNTNFTNKEVYQLLQDAKNANITSGGMLDDFLRQRGYGSIAQYFAYHDNGGVKVYVYKDEFDEEAFGSMLGRQKSGAFIQGSGQYFIKPTKVETFLYPDKVGKQDRWQPLDAR